MIDISIVNEALKKNYDLVNQKLRYTFKKGIEVIVVRGDKEAISENIEAETRKGNILIYEDVFEKLYGVNNNQAIIQTVSHEFWHIFSAKYKFYHKLEVIYETDRLVLDGLRKKDLVSFIGRLNSISDREVERLLLRLREVVPCWTEGYIEEMAWLDSEKKFLNRVDNFRLRGW